MSKGSKTEQQTAPHARATDEDSDQSGKGQRVTAPGLFNHDTPRRADDRKPRQSAQPRHAGQSERDERERGRNGHCAASDVAIISNNGNTYNAKPTTKGPGEREQRTSSPRHDSETPRPRFTDGADFFIPAKPLALSQIPLFSILAVMGRLPHVTIILIKWQ